MSRYTLTYTPSLDRILPCPSHLCVKIRNASAIPLRAAYIVGPYTLYTACYPSGFDPNKSPEGASEDGAPEFEPNLKAGGIWNSRLTVPEKIRETAGKANVEPSTDSVVPSVTWVIDISSQVIFSMTAAVNFELLVGRDEKSVELGFAGLGSKTGTTAGRLEDHSMPVHNACHNQDHYMPRGIYSAAVGLLVENTDQLWNKPAFPSWGPQQVTNNENAKRQIDPTPIMSPLTDSRIPMSPGIDRRVSQVDRRQKKVHLVVLTHGLHGNMGADLLYLKESIDSAATQAKESRKRRRQNDESAGSDEDDEEVIVRGFPGNACRTERGVQYLGKRVAKWVLSVTYPDQGYLPQRKSMKKKLSRVFTFDQANTVPNGKSQHNHTSVYHPGRTPEPRPYKITSISFIAHSLGGLTQTYAIAYIHKHSPQFFDDITPINFVTMATPFLGLSNENPLYVRFALDFGLVGRTGQDLGLSWRTPTVVRSGWEAMIGGIGNESQKAQKQPDPGSKPLLRILPTGHTHQVLKRFRNRTVYSNVVNDGIVPPRTSCLLFLDWSGLGRVEKARRENGLIGTTLGWGWAELTGANSSSRTYLRAGRDSEMASQSDISDNDAASMISRQKAKAEVPQPTDDAVTDDAAQARKAIRSRSVDARPRSKDSASDDTPKRRSSVQHQLTSPISGFLSIFRPTPQKHTPPKSNQSPKQTKIYQRSQTTKIDTDGSVSPSTSTPAISRSGSPSLPGPVRGDSLLEDPESVFAPPKTSIFESAGDVLNPPLPTTEFITDPDHRPQTIFHDRVYHPEDIPPPRAKRPRRLSRSASSDSRQGQSNLLSANGEDKVKNIDTGDMKVEEKIARAYHYGLSWRKVLVRLEPDAHNNIVVRRMFANAYGWPVIKHLVDTHFADTYEANTADRLESNEDHADIRIDEPTEDSGYHNPPVQRTDSEMREAADDISDLRARGVESKRSSYSSKFPSLSRQDSARWDDTLFDVTDESEEESPHGHARKPLISFSTSPDSPKGTSETEIADFLTRSPLPTDSPKDSWKGKAAKAPAGGTATVGLARSMDEQLSLGSPTNGNGKGMETKD